MSQIFKVLCLLAMILMTGSCEKHYVTVTRVGVDKTSLASLFVATPDPRLKSPPKGEQLVIEWNLPSKEEKKKLFLELSLVYNNCTEEVIRYDLQGIRGVISYFLLGEKYQTTEGLMTYKVEIKTVEGKVIKQWKEQLWIRLIQLEEESDA